MNPGTPGTSAGVRLRDLDAVLVTVDPGDSRQYHYSRHGESIHGVEFDCPTLGHGERILVWFKNPIGPSGPGSGGLPVRPDVGPLARWTVVSGTTVDDLTLSPSINVHGDWHGWIRNGCAVSA